MPKHSGLQNEKPARKRVYVDTRSGYVHVMSLRLLLKSVGKFNMLSLIPMLNRQDPLQIQLVPKSANQGREPKCRNGILYATHLLSPALNPCLGGLP